MNERCYVLVKTQTDAWALYQACRSADLVARIAPTPRVADVHASCGTSLLIDCGLANQVQVLANDAGIDLDGIARVKGSIDPARDRFC